MGKSMVSGSDSSLKPLDHGVWLKCPVRTGRTASFHHSFGHRSGDEWWKQTVSVKVRGNIYELLLACLPPDFIVKEIRQLEDFTWGSK